jgi:hypothetical protein
LVVAAQIFSKLPFLMLIKSWGFSP